MASLSISLVTYHPNISMLRDTLASLRVAVDQAIELDGLTSAHLFLVDNGDDAGLDVLAAENGWSKIGFVTGQGNVGFGCGHNLAIGNGMGDLHLILNPDVYIEPQALVLALDFMREHPECGLLSPSIVGGQDGWHFLCKRYPSVFDLFLRGFAPRWMRKAFEARMERYEMKTKSGQDVVWDPPIVSGCFMLCRAELLASLGGFDPRYFLYFEDFDLSLRARKITRLAAVAAVRIAHFGGGAARKGSQHVRMFCRSARLFFAVHGWQWF